jgi:hypothetical protein
MTNTKDFTKPILNKMGLFLKMFLKYIFLIFLIVSLLEIWKNIPETEGGGVIIDISMNQFHTKTDIIYNPETLSEFKNFLKYMVN